MIHLKRFAPVRLRVQYSRVITISLIFITLGLISVQSYHIYSNNLFQNTQIPVISADHGSNSALTRPESIAIPVTEIPEDEIFPIIPDKQTQAVDYKDTKKINQLMNTDNSFKSFVNDLLEKIYAANPSIGAINNRAHYNKENKFEKSWDQRMPVLNGKLRENNGVDPIRTKQYLSSFMKLSESEIQAMKDSHDKFVNEMPSEYPPDVQSQIKGSGILFAGGGNYNWLVLLSIKMLRDLGSKLPIEVFIPTDSDYSIELCDRVFPIFDAKCIAMSSFINKKVKLKGYQLKSMALILTSFEKVLLLDSDNLPVKNPDHIFFNEPFISKGMVVWPDFWRRSTSPSYYDIVGIKINETNQVRFSYNDERDHPTPLKTLQDYQANVSYHDLEGTFPEASSESGQLLINKKTHAKSIFLSLYYNYYGPQYYYGLMSQGQAGEGDKETFLASAHELGLPYYQVEEFIREYGKIRENGDGGIDIAAMGQYDPVIDYIQSQDYDKYKSNYPYDRNKDNYLFHKFNKSETLFLHCNQPKLYPWNVQGKGLKDFLEVKEGSRRRLYSKFLIDELGYDFELKIWDVIKWGVCEHGDLNIKGMNNPDVWCTKVKDHIDFLYDDIPTYFDDLDPEKLDS